MLEEKGVYKKRYNLCRAQLIARIKNIHLFGFTTTFAGKVTTFAGKAEDGPDIGMQSMERNLFCTKNATTKIRKRHVFVVHVVFVVLKTTTYFCLACNKENNKYNLYNLNNFRLSLGYRKDF